MDQLTDVLSFVRKFTANNKLNAESDIFKCGTVGDDFHEMIEDYAKKYEVDLTEYLWYFHADDEGFNLGGLFFKPPYARVKRIPVTPRLLSEFAKKKKWNIQYPKHTLPKRRFDIIINQLFVFGSALFLIIGLINKLILGLK